MQLLDNITAIKNGYEALTFKKEVIAFEDEIRITKDAIYYLIYDTCPPHPGEIDDMPSKEDIQAYQDGEVYCLVKEILVDGVIKDYDLIGGYYGITYALEVLRDAENQF
jgi:hypothetical protein